MAGAEKLKEKILSDARVTADKNISQARREAEAIVHKAREEAQSVHSSYVAKAERDAIAREKRMVSVAELEGRKEKLAEKQRLIDELFEKAIRLLCDKPDSEYEEMLVGMLAASASGDEEVIVSDKDMARLSSSFIGNVNKALVQKGKPGMLTLSKETRPIFGGYILRTGRIEVNNSFESIVKTKRDNLETLAVKMLFG